MKKGARVLAVMLVATVCFQTATATAAATAQLSQSSGAVVEPGGGRIGGNNDGDSIELDSERQGGGVDAAPMGTAPQRVKIARYTFACLGNTYLADPPVNESCEAAVQNCVDNVTDRQYLRWTTVVQTGQAPPPPGPAWTLDGAACITPEEATEAQITFTLADFRRLPLPAAEPAIQPAGGQALIRMRTNAYVDPSSTDPQTFDITLLGTPVQVRATPASYTWDYGDGSEPVTTTDPGAPYPDLTTWHAYEDPGQVSITLTTSYTGEYSVAGGPWVAIPGTAEVASPPQPLELLGSSNRLTG